MLRRFFYISLFLLILTLIILTAYNLVFKNNALSPKATESATENLDKALEESTSQEAIATGKLENILSEEVISPAIGENGNLYYYSLTDKALKQASFEGKDKKTLLSNLPGATERVIWSPKKDQCLIALRQGKSLRFHLADITTKTLTPLKGEISRATWNVNGTAILYQYKTASGEYTLDRANPDGSGFRTLTSLGKIDHFIEPIPQSNRVAFWTRPNGLETTILESVTETGEDRKNLFTERYGVDYLWAPNGKKAVLSTLSGRGKSDVSLALINENGGELKNLAIPTLISKVTWSKDSKTLYYALPGNLPPESVLPNDYYQKPLHSEDTFWKIDTETGQKSRLLELTEAAGNIDSSNFFLSPKEDYLFFLDRKTNRLFRVEL